MVCGRAFAWLLFREFGCDLLPGWLRQLLEKNRQLDRIHLLGNRDHLFFRKGMQQNKCFVVREDWRQPGGNLDRQTPEKDLL